jgi:hypothetical protein
MSSNRVRAVRVIVTTALAASMMSSTVNHLGGGCRAPARAVHEVMHDLRRAPRQGFPGHGLIEDAHYAHVITRPAQVGEQGGAESREPALGGRVGTK